MAWLFNLSLFVLTAAPMGSAVDSKDVSASSSKIVRERRSEADSKWAPSTDKGPLVPAQKSKGDK